MYRKFTADQYFDGYRLWLVPPVLITDEGGTIIDVVEAANAGEDVLSLRGLLTPGFVNAHCHLELSHLKGLIPEGTGLVDFVQTVMSSRGLGQEQKMEAMLAADAELYAGGTVAVGDICNTADSIPVKQQSKLQWHNFIEVSGFTDTAAQKRFDDAALVYEQFLTGLEGSNTTMSPHAPYSVSRKLFQLLNHATADQLITIHNQEAAAENELYQHKQGKFLQLYDRFGIDISNFSPSGQSAFKTWLPYFTHAQSIIAVHNSFTTEGDLAFARQLPEDKTRGIAFCICINANLYIEQQVPPINILRANGPMLIGTDSYASNHQLNVFEEIKTIQRQTGHSIPLPELLGWATSNGARALQLEQNFGSFKKGKKPGIVLVEGLDNLQTTAASVARRIL